MIHRSLLVLPLCAFLAACEGEGDGSGMEGDPCTSDADCADGLECHEHDGEMECEAHDDEEA